jgi:hypothetical protein
MASRFAVYFEKVKTTKVYLRDCSPISPYPLLLFGGKLDVQHAESVITVDGWIGLKGPRKVAVLFKMLRFQLDMLLRTKVEVCARCADVILCIFIAQ